MVSKRDDTAMLLHKTIANYQLRSQGLLGFQHGGVPGEDPGITLAHRTLMSTLIGLMSKIKVLCF